MNWELSWQLIRYLLIAAGGYLTSKGLTDDATVQAMVGAVMILGPAIQGIIVKWGTKSVPAIVVEASRSPLTPEAPIPTVSPVTGAVTTNG